MKSVILLLTFLLACLSTAVSQQEGLIRWTECSPSSKMLRVSRGVQAAKLVSASDIALPDELDRAIRSKTVIVDLKVNVDGTNKCVGLAARLEMLPDTQRMNEKQRDDLLDVLSKAMIDWKYQPTFLNGEAVDVESTVTFKKSKHELQVIQKASSTKILPAKKDK